MLKEQGSRIIHGRQSLQEGLVVQGSQSGPDLVDVQRQLIAHCQILGVAGDDLVSEPLEAVADHVAIVEV